MLGKQEFQPKLFLTQDVDRLVPENHKLKKLDKVLDLGFLRDLSKPFYSDSMGRPSIDPEVFFRMQIVSYFYGIESDRELCDEIQVNLAFRWFLGLSLEDSVPDHSSLTRIRDRLGLEVVQSVFEKILAQCQSRGLIDGKKIFVDSTIVQADASWDSLATDGKRDEKDNNKDDDSQNPPKTRRYSNKTHISSSDPDCRITKKNRKTVLGYKIQYSVDAKERIILDPYVALGNKNDCQLLINRVEFQKTKLGMNIQTVVADRGYSSEANYEELESQNIEHWIPPFDRFHQAKQPIEQKIKRPSFTGRAWKKLYTRSDEFSEHLRERMWKSEGLFSEAKGRHGLGRCRHRGIVKTQIQAYMTALVQNLKRMADIHRRKSENWIFDLFFRLLLPGLKI